MRYLPFLAFFLSGASGLVFQTIWSRLLHHVFGSSSVAISSVVSAFMGGLALGAWLFGKYADRVRHPLRVYALVEVGVGIAGLLVPVLVNSQGWLAEVNSWLRQQLAADSGEFMVARFLCILPILIVPTTLMGATLPLLARHFVSVDADGETASRQVGQLYAINTIGAVFGVFMAGFVLMPSFGVAVTNTLAVGTNFALAAFIFLLQGPLARAAESRPASASSAPSKMAVVAIASQRWPNRVRRTAAVAFALSGAVSLLCEVVWSRALVNTVGASVYAFALILMTFLVGIAGGSAVASSFLAARGRTMNGTAWASAALLPIACAAVWVHHGSGAFAAWMSTAAAVLGLIQWLRRRDLQIAAAVDPTVTIDQIRGGRDWQTLAVPAATSLLAAIIFQDRLAGMGTSVVLLIAVLLLMLHHGRARPVLLLAGIQLYIALSSFTSDLWADELSIAFASTVAPLYSDLPNHVGTVMTLMSITAGLCVLPSAFGMGAMFPVTIRVWSRGGAQVGRDVGIIYTGNTVGSIAGAWLPGFVLVPIFGMQGTLHVGIALNLLLACAIVMVAVERRGSALTRRAAFSLAATVPVLIAGMYLGTSRGAPWLTWNISKMTLGAFRISLARDVLDEEAWGAPELVYHRDGISTTVTVERWGRHYSLKNNGKVEASNGDDMPTQIMVAALPMLLHRGDLRELEVAVVGFGSGVTVGAALQFPVRSVEAVELERAVVDASRFFADVNHFEYTSDRFPYVSEPRLTVHNDDGRNFLAASHKRYDVIVSEPSNPWITGVSDLFTREHFEVSRGKLAPGGVYCQWVQLYEMSPENVKVIYRTFASHFKHVRVFSAEDLSSDTILVGSDSPLTLDLARLRRSMALPTVRAELERAYVHVPQDVFARILLASRDEVMRYTQVEERRVGGRWRAVPAADNSAPCPPLSCRRRASPINTDDNAHIEFAAPRDLIGFERYKGYLRSMYAPEWPYGKFSRELRGLGDDATAAAGYAQQAMSLIAHGRKREASEAVRLAKTRGSGPTVKRADAMLESLSEGLSDMAPAEAEPDLTGLSEPMARRLRDATRIANRALGKRAWSEAFEALDGVPEMLRQRAGASVQLLYAHLSQRVDKHARVIESLQTMIRRKPRVAIDHPELYYLLARSHDALDHFDKAVRNMRVFLDARQAMLVAQAGPEPSATGGETDARGRSDKAFRTVP